MISVLTEITESWLLSVSERNLRVRRRELFQLAISTKQDLTLSDRDIKFRTWIAGDMPLCGMDEFAECIERLASDEPTDVLFDDYMSESYGMSYADLIDGYAAHNRKMLTLTVPSLPPVTASDKGLMVRTSSDKHLHVVDGSGKFADVGKVTDVKPKSVPTPTRAPVAISKSAPTSAAHDAECAAMRSVLGMASAMCISEAPLQPNAELYKITEMLATVKLPALKVLDVQESHNHALVWLEATFGVPYEKIGKATETLKQMCLHFGYDSSADVITSIVRWREQNAVLIAFPKAERTAYPYPAMIREKKRLGHDGVTFGISPDKTLVTVPWNDLTFTFVSGGTGSGKTLLSYSVLTQVVERGDTAFFLIDMKDSKKDWGMVRDAMPRTRSGGTFSEAIMVLRRYIQTVQSGKYTRCILAIDEYDKLTNSALVASEENAVDTTYPTADQHDEIGRMLILITTTLRSLGAWVYAAGQGEKRKNIGSQTRAQFSTQVGMWLGTDEASKAATGLPAQRLYKLAQRGGFKLYVNSRIIAGHAAYCTQDVLAAAIRKYCIANVDSEIL